MFVFDCVFSYIYHFAIGFIFRKIQSHSRVKPIYHGVSV